MAIPLQPRRDRRCPPLLVIMAAMRLPFTHPHRLCRLAALVAAVVYFFYKRSILGTIALGMLVYLPLHIGVGW